MDTLDRNKKAAARVDAGDLTDIAARAVARAQAARQASMTELSPEQAKAVSGGATSSAGFTSTSFSTIVSTQAICPKPPIVYGGFPLPVNQLSFQLPGSQLPSNQQL